MTNLNPNSFVQTILLDYMSEHGIDPLSEEGQLFFTSLGLLQISSPTQTVTVTLSAAQMKSLIASPAQLVTAPGVGKYIEVVDAALQYKGGTTPYTLDQPSGVLLVQWGASPLDVNGPFESVSLQGFLDQLTNKVQNHLLNNGLTHDQTDVENKGLFMTYGGGGSQWRTDTWRRHLDRHGVLHSGNVIIGEYKCLT